MKGQTQTRKTPRVRWGFENAMLQALCISAVVFLFVVGLYSLVYWLLSLLSGEMPCIQGVVKQVRDVVSEATVAVALLSGIATFLARQWQEFAERERKQTEQRREALRELEQLSTLLDQRQYSEAVALYRRFQERCKIGYWQDIGIWDNVQSLWQQKAPLPLQRWTELLKSEEEAGNCEGSVSKPDLITLEALIWGHRLDLRTWEEKGEKIISQLIIPDNLEHLASLFGKEPEFRRSLLRSEIVGQRLEELHQRVSETQRQHLDTLLKWRKLPPVGIPLPWEKIGRPPDPQEFAEWLKQHGFQINPFGPEMAELDPWLSEYGHWPSALEFARGPRPALVLGPPGSGRTAAALLLYQKCLWPPGNPEEAGTFPVWLEPISWPRSPDGWLEEIGRALAEALLRVCGRDPYALFTAPEMSATVVSLFARYFGPADRIEPHLRRQGLSGSTLDYVLGEVEAYAGLVPGKIPDQVTLKDLIGKARPADMKFTYLILDVPTFQPTDGDPRLTSLKALLEMTGPLARQGVYLKLFLPERVGKEVLPSWPLPPIFLEAWPESDLRQMLEKRLSRSGNGQVEALSAIWSEQEYPPDPDTWLVQSAQGLPRRLVELGNQMLWKAWEKTRNGRTE